MTRTISMIPPVQSSFQASSSACPCHGQGSTDRNRRAVVTGDSQPANSRATASDDASRTGDGAVAKRLPFSGRPDLQSCASRAPVRHRNHRKQPVTTGLDLALEREIGFSKRSFFSLRALWVATPVEGRLLSAALEAPGVRGLHSGTWA